MGTDSSTTPKHLLPLAALVSIAVLGCDRTFRAGNSVTANPSRSIYALGRLEPSTGIISISAVPGERLKELDPDVEVNKRVPANGILGLLTSYDLGKAQLEALLNKKDLAEKKLSQQVAVAKAQKAQAEASLAQARAKLKELELQTSKLRAMETAGDLAAEEFAEAEALHAKDPDLMTEHQLRKRRNEMDTKLADFKVASESYASTKEAAERAVAAAQANIEVANISLEQLKHQYEIQSIDKEIEVAEETLKRSILLSPNVVPESVQDVLRVACVEDHGANSDKQRGPYTVLKIYLRPGEFVTQTPILQLGDLRDMVCVAEVYDADVKDLHIGQRAVIRSPAFSGKFADRVDPETKERLGGIEGHIEQIGGVIGTPGLMNRNPLAPADRSVVEVRIAIDDEEAIAEAAHRVSLQVTVEFDKSSDVTEQAESSEQTKPAEQE